MYNLFRLKMELVHPYWPLLIQAPARAAGPRTSQEAAGRRRAQPWRGSNAPLALGHGHSATSPFCGPNAARSTNTARGTNPARNTNPACDENAARDTHTAHACTQRTACDTNTAYDANTACNTNTAPEPHTAHAHGKQNKLPAASGSSQQTEESPPSTAE